MSKRQLMPFLLVPLWILIASSSSRAQSNCTDTQCHAALLKGATVHAATEACDSCHEETSTPHPQKGKTTFKLTADIPELCSTCHEPFGSKKTIHPPVQEGSCTTCHDPHSSDQPRLLVQPAGELCVMCHGDKNEFPVLHGPVATGDCTACHNPHETDTPSLLVQEGEKLCVTCHQDLQVLLQRKNLHPALEAGCTSCHNPHGSEQPKLLLAAGKDVCFQCHSDISELIEGARVVHAPVESDTACVTCHNPHAANHERLLAQEEKAVCLGCHTNVITRKMTVLHGPIQEGKCTPCHNPHAGSNPKLLVKKFPETPYVAYSQEEYALCFSCHNSDLAAYPDTSFATNFRDGERNLHYLHVNRQEKGRSCRLCHSLHGSASPKLIAESVPFGKWNLPLNYEMTENGGSCTPGCHKQYRYDRKSPATPAH